MKTYTQNDIDDILDAVSFARPQLDAYNTHMAQQEYEAAIDVLKEELSAKNAKIVVNFYREKQEVNVRLVEIELNDIPLKEDETLYLFKAGTQIVQTRIYYMRDKYGFFLNSSFLPLGKAQQAWVVQNTALETRN